MASAGKAMSKTDVLNALAERTGLGKKEIATVFEQLKALIGTNLGPDGPGAFTVPGLLKITVQHKPATPERTGINRFTGQETVFKARPAKNVVKVRPLKGLKELA